MIAQPDKTKFLFMRTSKKSPPKPSNPAAVHQKKRREKKSSPHLLSSRGRPSPTTGRLPLSVHPVLETIHRSLDHAVEPAEVLSSLLQTNVVHIHARADDKAPVDQAQDQRDPEHDQAAAVVQNLQRDDERQEQDEDGQEVRHGGEEVCERLDDQRVEIGGSEVANEGVDVSGARVFEMGRGFGGEEFLVRGLYVLVVEDSLEVVVYDVGMRHGGQLFLDEGNEGYWR